MEPRRSKHYLARIPTIALLVLFAMSPELSILFFILRAIDRDALKKEQENADYASDFRAEDTRADQSARSAATTRPFTATTSPPPSRRTRKSGTRT